MRLRGRWRFKPGWPKRFAWLRRRDAPVALGHWEGYAVPAGSYTARRGRSTRSVAVLGLWVVGIVVSMMALSVITIQLAGSPTRYVCPPDCGRPPTGFPVATNPRFTASNGEFSVSYPDPGAAYTVTKEPNGVTATWNGGDGGTLRLFSEPANGREAQEIAEKLLQKSFPDAKKDYELPNAMVGFQPGYGEVADYWPQGAARRADQLRVIIVVAVKNDLALVAALVGPNHPFGEDFGPGPPSAAAVQLAMDMGKYVNSFSWRGDPAR